MPYYAQRATSVAPRGPWEADHWYEVGDLATLNGSMWYAASRNINDPPPSRSWWGPFLLGGIPGVGGGHIIQDTWDNDFPARTYLRFERTIWEEGDDEWLLITDDAGNDQTVVTYDTEPVTPELLQDTIGRGYDLIDIPLTANFAHPDPEADPPVTAKMGMDNFGIAHFQGKVTATVASPSPGSDLLMCTLPAGLLPFGQSDIRLPIWVDSATPHEPPHLRIQGDGDVYLEIADAGDVVHLDGVRYVAGLGGRRIARDNEFFTPEEPEAFSVGSPFGGPDYGYGLRRAIGYGVVNSRGGPNPWFAEETYGVSLAGAVAFPLFVRNYKTHPDVGTWTLAWDPMIMKMGWEVVEGPDQGLSHPIEPLAFGWVPFPNQDDYPWPMYSMPDWNPAFFASDQVIMPPPYPYTSIDSQVWVYLRTAPQVPGNIFRVFVDITVGWDPYPNYYDLGDSGVVDDAT